MQHRMPGQHVQRAFGRPPPAMACRTVRRAATADDCLHRAMARPRIAGWHVTSVTALSPKNHLFALIWINAAWVVRHDNSACFRDIRDSSDEPFPRPADLLQEAGRHLRRRPRRRHRRAARLGGRLPQALAARQDRALHPRRELHRLLLVEDLRQGRHRHLGDAADRLSAHAPGSAEPRAARLRARRQLLLVSVFGQPA